MIELIFVVLLVPDVRQTALAPVLAPPNSELVEEAIVNVLGLAHDPQAAEEAKFAIEPLLFILDPCNDRAINGVLSRLLSYSVGESNRATLDCLIRRRAVRDPAISPLKISHACRKKFGQSSIVCERDDELKEHLRELNENLARHVGCALEY